MEDPAGACEWRNLFLFSYWCYSSAREKVLDQQKLAEVAPPAYFYVQKRDIGHVSHLPWGGSSASLLPGYVQNAERTRKLSIRSGSSEDSGYASGDAHSVSENLAAISEDETEEQARLGS